MFVLSPPNRNLFAGRSDVGEISTLECRHSAVTMQQVCVEMICVLLCGIFLCQKMVQHRRSNLSMFDY